MTGETRTEILEHIDDSGKIFFVEKFERILPLSEIPHDNAYKLSCEACEKFRRNLSCPPYSPSFNDYIPEAESAKVICLRMPQEYFGHLFFRERYHECFKKTRQILVAILLDYREKGYTVAGSGACLECEKCAVELGSVHCIKPGKMIYSLESLGTNLITLTQKCFDIDLEWNSDGQSADFVCAVGAIFAPLNAAHTY